MVDKDKGWANLSISQNKHQYFLQYKASGAIRFSTASAGQTGSFLAVSAHLAL